MKNKLYSFVHLTSYLTILHGFLYALIKYFLKVETEYGVRAHEYQSLTQAIHIVLSPLLIFSFGLLFKDHIYPKLVRFREKKLSGTALVVIFILMSFSGYLVQVVYQESPREFFIWIHIITSALWTLFYLIHHKSKA
jgi:uncharacterized membrane protein